MVLLLAIVCAVVPAAKVPKFGRCLAFSRGRRAFLSAEGTFPGATHLAATDDIRCSLGHRRSQALTGPKTDSPASASEACARATWPDLEALAALPPSPSSMAFCIPHALEHSGPSEHLPHFPHFPTLRSWRRDA